MMKKVTAGKDILGDFAPKFAELNDEILFGQVWAREEHLSQEMIEALTHLAFYAGWPKAWAGLDYFGHKPYSG